MAPALQITIPTTTTCTPTSSSGSSSSKPYTQYHILLQLPLRKHELPKRYTDFVTLHENLTSQTGAPPPAPLPPKSWLRRTVGNDALTEERRAGLERYLQAIVESEDGRWRSCGAWRGFLNLPSGGQTTANTSNSASSSAMGGGGRRESIGGSGGGGVNDPNQWLDVHREMKAQIQTARQQLKQREAAGTAAAQHAMSAEAKASLVRAAAGIAQLEDGLRRMTAEKGKGEAWGGGGGARLGEGEMRRRRDLVGAARKEVEGLEGLLRSMAVNKVNTASSAVSAGAVASAGDKEGLWRGTSAAAAAKPSGRVLGGGGGALKETERTRERDNSGVLQLQQQIMVEQEEDVMSLGKTVSRLKDMGILINEELTVQNEMLGLLEGDTERVQGKIDVARRRIGKIS